MIGGQHQRYSSVYNAKVNQVEEMRLRILPRAKHKKDALKVVQVSYASRYALELFSYASRYALELVS
jgi:hypothetical protein